MKLKITFASLLFLCTFVSFAQFSPVGHLTIFSENGDKFFLVLNGEQQNDVAQTNLRIEDLNQPYYNAQIIFADKSRQTISKNNLTLTDADGIFQDVTYKIKRDKNKAGKMKMNFFSMIPVRPDYIAPKNVYVMHYGQPQAQVNTGVNVGINMNVNINESNSHAGHDHHDGHNHEGHNHNGNQAPKGCLNSYPMSPANFNSAVATIKKQSFDDSKMKTAQQVVSANCLNVKQIMQVANLFSFEDNKLEFAKFAYDFCTDPKSYYELNAIFKFSSNADALSDYIQSR
jgi:hypothetical protein